MSNPKLPPKPWTQLETKDIAQQRAKILKEQLGKCLICGATGDVVWSLDHEHRKRIGGSGLIRGVLCRACNSTEGRVISSLVRGGIKKPEMADWLRNLAGYLDKPHYPLIHPTEREYLTITRTDFNKLNAKFKIKYPRKAPLKYPNKGRITKKLLEIMKEFE